MIPYPKRILVRGVNWLGDAVISSPTLQRLREAAPNSDITLLTHTKLAVLFHHYSHIYERMTFHSTERSFALS